MGLFSSEDDVIVVSDPKLNVSVSKNVSVSAYQRLGLGLVSDPKLNVSVSILVSSRTGSETSRSRLGLGPQRLVYIPGMSPHIHVPVVVNTSLHVFQ